MRKNSAYTLIEMLVCVLFVVIGVISILFVSLMLTVQKHKKESPFFVVGDVVVLNSPNNIMSTGKVVRYYNVIGDGNYCDVMFFGTNGLPVVTKVPIQFIEKIEAPDR